MLEGDHDVEEGDEDQWKQEVFGLEQPVRHEVEHHLK